ncbi:hypothetical protein TNCV_3477691 [Trichonephila clavipes]|nr:hypothetical protein TNCV_3477691 [Trichonephila clavipes]
MVNVNHPQPDSDSTDCIFQQDGAPHSRVRRFVHFSTHIFQSVGWVDVEMPLKSSALGYRDPTIAPFFYGLM